MITVKGLMTTNVAHAKSELESLLERDPDKAGMLANLTLAELEKAPGNLTRIAMLRTIVRRAENKLAQF